MESGGKDIDETGQDVLKLGDVYMEVVLFAFYVLDSFHNKQTLMSYYLWDKFINVNSILL